MKNDAEFRKKMEELEKEAMSNSLRSRIPQDLLDLIATNIRKYLDSGMSVSDMSEKMIGALTAIVEDGSAGDEDPVVKKLLVIAKWEKDK